MTTESDATFVIIELSTKQGMVMLGNNMGGLRMLYYLQYMRHEKLNISSMVWWYQVSYK